MDFNFEDLKKEAAATAENIYNEAADRTKQTAYDVLSEAGQQDDNAHTEQFFANEQKNLDLEHVDPQAFVQRMSAGAKEAQEQLDAKFAQPLAKEIDDIFATAVNTANQRKMENKEMNVHDMTVDFMNAERGLFRHAPEAAEVGQKQLNVIDDDLLVMNQQKNILLPNPTAANTASVPAPTSNQAPVVTAAANQDDFFEKPLPAVPQQEQQKQHIFDDDFTGLPAASKINKDSDTDSPSISYTPSPAKKVTTGGALKEQDNDKFISSEDLLGDFKDERTTTAEIQKPSVTTASGFQATVPTTDLDEEDDNNFGLIDTKTSNKPIIDTVKEIKSAVAEDFEVSAPSKVTESPKPSTVTDKKTKSPTGTDLLSDAQQPKLLSVEQLFCKYGLDAWFKPERLHPQVESLIYWRDVRKSGIVFGSGVTAILAISCFSVISVFAWISLILLSGTVAFRIYKNVMQAIQKTSDGHPFEQFLEFDLTISQEKAQHIAGVAVAHINGFTTELRRLFLVEDFVDSIKFGILLWVMTYIGAWSNGMTLVLLAFIALFTLPKIYENNKESIDTYLDLVISKFTEISDRIKAAIPIGNKKPIAAESDKDK